MRAVLTATRDGVLTITLNRPERLNAVSTELYQGVVAALAQAEDEPTTRAVLITGAGRAFCVGADLKAHAEGRTPDEQAEYVRLGQHVCERIQHSPLPVVAAVQGYALGAGAELAVSADFLVIAEDAQMGFPEVSIGTFVGGGITHRLPRLVGLRRALELLVLGERFTGQDALAWGLANRTAPADELLEVATGLAGELAGKAPISMARMKGALQADPSLADALDGEATDLLAIMQTADWAEGVAAFAEKRRPAFVGS